MGRENLTFGYTGKFEIQAHQKNSKYNYSIDEGFHLYTYSVFPIILDEASIKEQIKELVFSGKIFETADILRAQDGKVEMVRIDGGNVYQKYNGSYYTTMVEFSSLKQTEQFTLLDYPVALEEIKDQDYFSKIKVVGNLRNKHSNRIWEATLKYLP